MVFSSLLFIYAFLPLSLLVYLLCKTMRAKNISLLVFSLIFYTWGEPKYVLLLAAMAAFDWVFALQVEKSRKRGGAKVWLSLACIVNLGLIGFFKYSRMICSIFGQAPAFVEKIALPLGISFYTFQLLTYVIDVYRGEAKAEREYWHVLLYAALFHQCIAGPIVRYNSIAEELFVRRGDVNELPEGILRFSAGLAKKVILANGVGALADRFLLPDAVLSDAAAFAANAAQLSGQSVLGLWLGVACYSLQIYFDFSAYSDMAIGMGKMLGLHYVENFNYPYISRSVTEFWRRWHISLSTFFRDYVYIPLGGNRKGGVRTVLNLFVVWALTGLWHGASWNFVLWGLYFFVFLMIEKPILRANKKAGKANGAASAILGRLYLIPVVMLGWVLFRFTDMRYIPIVLKGLVGANGNALSGFEATANLRSNMYFLGLCVVACTPVFRYIAQGIKRFADKGGICYVVGGAVIYAAVPIALLVISTARLVGATFNPFLYFRF